MKNVLILLVLSVWLPGTYGTPTYLSNTDFATGTYQITTPGTYILNEDIEFKPNPPSDPSEIPSCCMVQTNQFSSNGGDYDDNAFSLGFFAAIAISADSVELDLNGFMIEQSPEHALMQRFFAVIELADQPFIPGQGPHNFGASLQPATNVYIHSGTIGRSSHHGIHGNGNEDITITNVDFQDYEVAAVHLNGVNGLTVTHSYAYNRKDVPVLGTFSAAIFIQHYLHYLHTEGSSTTLRVQGTELNITDVKAALENQIINVYQDVSANGVIDSNTHPDEYALFHNKHGVVDGNSYGFVTNKLGVAVLGFPHAPTSPYTSVPSMNIDLSYVYVVDHIAAINEVVAMNEGGAITDPVGAIFQVKNTHPDNDNVYVTISSSDDYVAEYTGNALANAQAFVAKAIVNGEFSDSSLDVTRNKISQNVINWIEAGNDGVDASKLSTLMNNTHYLCNGDSMFHVNKGVVSFKIDATMGITMSNCHVMTVENLGVSGSDLCGDYTISHPDATLEGYGGANVRAFSFAGSSDGTISDCTVSDAKSNHGYVIGYDIFTDSIDIDFTNCDAFLIESVYGDAIGYHIGEDTDLNSIKDYCIASVDAPSGWAADILVEDGGTGNDIRNEQC